MKYDGCKAFWTIWAIGFYAPKDFRGKLYEFKIFLGPFVWTWFR